MKHSSTREGIRTTIYLTFVTFASFVVNFVLPYIQYANPIPQPVAAGER
jgi:hypothetical protein